MLMIVAVTNERHDTWLSPIDVKCEVRSAIHTLEYRIIGGFKIIGGGGGGVVWWMKKNDTNLCAIHNNT